MSRTHDNWERLVVATLEREELRRLALAPSLSSSFSYDSRSSFSFNSRISDSSSSTRSYGDVRPMSFKEIEKATKNFRSDMYLGQGEFGIVYKGWIHLNTLTASNGLMRSLSLSGKPVAIKKREQISFLGYTEWLSEIKYLSQIHHPNVVKLIGYCNDGHNMALVYEFASKGSLGHHLFMRHRQTLSWYTRIKVATGIASGLAFLHEGENQVIHRHFHVDSVLLDGDFNPKLSGFGFAMDGPVGDLSQLLNREFLGMAGYAAPELAKNGHVTVKWDVLSFGVVLLEILSGRPFFSSNKDNIVGWAKAYANDEIELSGIIDARLNGAYPQNAAHTAVTIAVRCLNSNPELRPRMSDALAALQRL